MLLLLLLSFGAAPVFAQNGGPAVPERTTRDGVFSAAQAERGHTVYSRVCADCHTRSEFSREEGVQGNWQGRTVFSVFQEIRSSMPDDDPAGLPRQDYIDVMAYLLRQYGYPAGESDLPATDDALKAIRITAPPDDTTSYAFSREPRRSRRTLTHAPRGRI
jgi:mono/diheme cytochrome c family protein